MSTNNSCQNRHETIAALVMGELEPLAAEKIKKHIDTCQTCHSFYQELAKEEETIRSTFKAIDDRSKMITKGLVLQLDKSPDRSLSEAPILPTIWGTSRFVKRTAKIAAAAVIIIVVFLFSWLNLQHRSSNGMQSISYFSLLSQACAAEQALFHQDGIVHIVNEIIVYPAPANISPQHNEQSELANINSRLDYTWLPMCSLQATGKFRFNQLKLSTDIDQPYTITDHAWYDPDTGRFTRVLEMGEKVIFANSYDGEFVYTSQTVSNGTLQIVKESVAGNFSPPQNPAEFLGISAGLRSSLDEENSPLIQDVSEGTLEDGSPARVYKAGQPGPNGELRAYWLFKVRDDDNTIAESEFVIAGKTQLVIRRLLSESVETPEISWSLAEIKGQDHTTQESPKVAITPDMVIPNVSVKHMVERASFETYVFSTTPSWTSKPVITDILDIVSPPGRMYLITCRANDGRHVVLVQAKTYNKMLVSKIKECRLAYTSPNGFKLWRGGPEKWFAGILLNSARASIKDPPADDRTGCILESPVGTFPTLAINGPVSDEELHGLIDSLIPAKGYSQE